MITKEKILEIIDKYANDNYGINGTYIDYLEFEDLAEELVKNCSMPNVVGQSEQLVCDHKPNDLDCITDSVITCSCGHKWHA